MFFIGLLVGLAIGIGLTALYYWWRKRQEGTGGTAVSAVITASNIREQAQGESNV